MLQPHIQAGTRFMGGTRCPDGRSGVGKCRFIVMAFLLSIIFISRTAGAADTALTREEKAWLTRHNNQIRLRIIRDFPPFAFTRTNGKPRGLSIDYVGLIEGKLNFKFKTIPSPDRATAEKRLFAAQTNVVAGIFRAHEASGDLVFTAPYLEIPYVVIAGNKTRGRLSLGLMRGMRVAVVRGFNAEEYIENNFPDIEPVPEKDPLSCLLSVLTNASDAAVVNLPAASHLMETHGIWNLRIAGRTEFKAAARLAVRSNRPMLKRILDKGLAMTTEKEREAVFRKWVHLDHGPFYKTGNFAAAVLGPLGIIILMLTWNRKLKQEVRSRTASLEEQTRALEREVASRIRAEKELRLGEAHLQAIIETIPGPVWLGTPGGKVISSNPQFKRFLGTLEKGVDNAPARGPSPAALLKNSRSVKASDAPLVTETEVFHADEGRSERLEIIQTPMLDPAGNLTGILGIGRDITRRRQAERELIRNRDRFESILSNFQGISYRCRKERGWTLVYMSPHVDLLTGYPPEHFMGNTLLSFDRCIHREDRKRVTHLISAAVAGDRPWESEYRIVHRNGEIHWVYERGAPIRDTGGKLGHLDGFIIDITGQKVMEEQLNRSREMESYGILASGISHDFNNILGGILGFIELFREDLEKKKNAEKMEAWIEKVHEGANRARELVDQILAFGRMEGEESEAVRIGTVAGEVSKLLTASLPSTIEVRTRLESNRAVRGNGSRIHQLLMKLCANAGHAVRESGGTLSITLREHLPGDTETDAPEDLFKGPFLHLCVAAEGRGTNRDDLERFITSRFAPGAEGSGTELWMIRETLRNMGGTMEVSGRNGKASRFDIHIPALDASDPVGGPEETAEGTKRTPFTRGEPTPTQPPGDP